MKPNEQERPIVVLVTDDEVMEEKIGNCVEQLEDALGRFPMLARYVDPRIKRKSCARNARDALDPLYAEAIKPALIVMDAWLSEEPNRRLQRREKPAVDLLAWLESELPDIPVLVASWEPGELVQRKALGRMNTGLLTLKEDSGPEDDSAMAFAEALAGLSIVGTATRRRYTIDVGSKSASYRVFNDGYKIIASGEIGYRDNTIIDEIAKGITEKEPDMLQLRAWGRILFDMLIEDTVGNHFTEILRNPTLKVGASNIDIELRFEIGFETPDREKIFSLPFELANQHNSFLCSRVPTARRLRLAAVNGIASVSPPVASTVTPYGCRVLFVKSLVSNTVKVADEKGTPLGAYRFSKLGNIDTELEILRHFQDSQGKRYVGSLTIIGDENPPLVGRALRDRLKNLLTEEEFDIVHFAGHSFKHDGDGSTYLVLPDTPGEALAVNVTSLAAWLPEGGCHLMVLSSCEGASVLTAMETMKRGAEGMIGFRWKVEDNLCADYFDEFYRSYLWSGRSIAESFRDASVGVHSGVRQVPTWASAVAVLRD
ncbi:CHAT domain-containing protein [Paraburkholderia atlantica]|uniref:CHAT domain-containing protein n=1 Tax=Paraburkholderia atlantica TaxID=2654982 RepID=UPI003D219CB9